MHVTSFNLPLLGDFSWFVVLCFCSLFIPCFNYFPWFGWDELFPTLRQPSIKGAGL